MKLNILPAYKPLVRSILDPNDENYNVLEWFVYSGRNSGKSLQACIIALISAIEFTNQGRHGQICLSRSFASRIKDSLYTECINLFIKYPELRDLFNISRTEITYPRNNPNIRITFQGTNKNPDSIKGLSNVLLFILDESDSVSELALKYLQDTIRENNSKIVFCFNPSTKYTDFGKYFFKNNPDLYKSYTNNKLGYIFTNYKDNIYLSDRTKDKIELSRQTYSPSLFDEIYNGKFNDLSEEGLLSSEIRSWLSSSGINLNLSEPVYAIWDLGVADYNVIYIFQYYNDNIYILDCISGNGQTVDYWINRIGYNIKTHYLPMDAKQRRGYTSIDTVIDIFSRRNINYEIISDYPNKDRLNKLRENAYRFNFNLNTNNNLKDILYILSKLRYSPGTDKIKHDGEVKDYYDPLSNILYTSIITSNTQDNTQDNLTWVQNNKLPNSLLTY